MSEPALLEVRDLSVSYGSQAVVREFSLDVSPGRCLGVIGESGAGKSQAFLAMLGLTPVQAHADRAHPMRIPFRIRHLVAV